MSAAQILPSNVETVQVDSLVLMKIVKHFESERALGGIPMIRGFITGLIATEDKRLELTNCFPCTTLSRGGDQPEEDDARQQDEVQEMLKRFRNMNMDYQLLGFYESANFGSAFNEYLVTSVFEYQTMMEDSVVVLYDNTKTSMGLVSLKAYRLSQAAMERLPELSPENAREGGLTYASLLEELPLYVKNSHLVNVALAEMQLLRAKQTRAPFLDLSHSGSLEKCLRALMNHLDELNGETSRYNKYAASKAKFDAIRDTHLQKRKLENESRRARGEQELGLDDLLKGKQTAPHPMLETFLAARDVKGHLGHALEVSAQNLGKLYLTEAVVEEKESKLRDRAASIVQDK